MLAVGARNRKIVALLLQPEMPWRNEVLKTVTQQDIDGNDALMIAINDNSIDILALLLKAGANQNAKKTLDQGKEIKARVPLTMAKSVAAVSALCNASKGALELKVGDESVLSGMLAKRRGQNLAERLLEHVGQAELSKAAFRTKDAREVEFLLHHVSADNINASDKQREELQKKLVVGVDKDVLSQALVRSVYRKNCFGGTAQFLLSSGANLSEALEVAISKNNMTMISKFLDVDWLSKSVEVLRTPKSAAAAAARSCEKKDTLEMLAKALMGDKEWEKEAKEYKATTADSQLSRIQRVVRDLLKQSGEDAVDFGAAQSFASSRPEDATGEMNDDTSDDDYDYDKEPEEDSCEE
jgi:hypothetical protein